MVLGNSDPFKNTKFLAYKNYTFERGNFYCRLVASFQANASNQILDKF